MTARQVSTCHFILPLFLWSLRNQGQEILTELVTTKCTEENTGDELLLGILYSGHLLLEMLIISKMDS